MSSKLLRGNVAIWVAEEGAFADPAAPTVAELTNSELVHDISCAVEDGYTLGMTDSDTDDSRSICDIGSVATPTYQNYEASLDGFRDEDPDATGVFNLFRDLFRAPDIKYYLIERVGPTQATVADEGQIISMFEVNTDYPVDGIDNNAPIMFGARFKTTGNLNVNYEIGA